MGAAAAAAAVPELLSIARCASEAVMTSSKVGRGTFGIAPEAEVITGAAAAVWVVGLAGMEKGGGMTVAGVAAGVDDRAVGLDGGTGVRLVAAAF